MKETTKRQQGKEQSAEKSELLSGNERFSLNGSDLGLSVKDYWQFQFSNLIDNLGYVAEFLVAKALEKGEPDNCNGWSLFDAQYKGKRIEVKASSYWQSWKKSHAISEQRIYSIRKTHVEYQNSKTELARQNDIYIFCIDMGRTEESANPLNLENWQFYVIPTKVIDKNCKDQKTISLNRIRQLWGNDIGLTYIQIKDAVDKIITELEVKCPIY